MSKGEEFLLQVNAPTQTTTPPLTCVLYITVNTTRQPCLYFMHIRRISFSGDVFSFLQVGISGKRHYQTTTDLILYDRMEGCKQNKLTIFLYLTGDDNSALVIDLSITGMQISTTFINSKYQYIQRFKEWQYTSFGVPVINNLIIPAVFS